MNTPSNLRYSKSHEWVESLGEGRVRIGLSDFAQKELGDLVFVNLPMVGDEVEMGSPFGDVESVKAVSDVYSPVTGTVSAVNETLLDSPEHINAAPYEAWLIEVEEVSEEAAFLTAADYAAFCESEASH